MALMPRNVPLAVAWRLLLLAAAVSAILAIGIHEYGWQPVGAKKMPVNQKDPVELLIRQEMHDDSPWAEPAEPPEPVAASPAAAPTPPPAATPTPAPKPADSKATVKAKPAMDENSLEDFLKTQETAPKKKKK
jgi:hypothetical protein